MMGTLNVYGGALSDDQQAKITALLRKRGIEPDFATDGASVEVAIDTAALTALAIDLNATARRWGGSSEQVFSDSATAETALEVVQRHAS